MDIFEWDENIPVTANNLNEMENILNDNILEEFSKRAKILWTNPNPSATMGNNVQITLSSDDYDILEVFVIYSNNNQSIMNSQKVLRGKGGMLMASTASGTPTIILRNFNYVSNTSYTLSIGKLKQLTSNTVSDNSSGCIPLYIIGYKTGLFN